MDPLIDTKLGILSAFPGMFFWYITHRKVLLHGAWYPGIVFLIFTFPRFHASLTYFWSHLQRLQSIMSNFCFLSQLFQLCKSHAWDGQGLGSKMWCVVPGVRGWQWEGSRPHHRCSLPDPWGWTEIAALPFEEASSASPSPGSSDKMPNPLCSRQTPLWLFLGREDAGHLGYLYLPSV